ncbi:MAG: hypothetical protein ACTSWW_08485, partial [Promethearchaeota archaeon]
SNREMWTMQIDEQFNDVDTLLQLHFNQTRQSLNILAQSAEMQNILNTPENSANFSVLLADLTDLFLTYSQHYLHFAQIRFLNVTGYEKIRVDNNATEESVYNVPDLQNKSQRYYFTGTMQLNMGEMYMSQLDLNQEYGQIQVPFLPVLRMALPLFSEEGDRKGILIINVNFNFFFDIITNILVTHEISFIDSKGFYFFNFHNQSEDWGQPINLNHTEWNVQQKSPELYSILQTQEFQEGELHNFQEGLFQDSFLVRKLQFGPNTIHEWFLYSVGKPAIYINYGQDFASELLLHLIILAVSNSMIYVINKQLIRSIVKHTVAENEIKVLRNILPICAHCKNIRDEDGHWHQLESYMHQHEKTDFSHGVCPDCEKKFYGDFLDDK